MYPDSEFAHSIGSFQVPVPLPSAGPDVEPFETICIASEWLPYLRGAAKQLLLQSTWDTTDPGMIVVAQEWAFSLIGMLQDGSCAPIIPIWDFGFGIDTNCTIYSDYGFEFQIDAKPKSPYRNRVLVVVNNLFPAVASNTVFAALDAGGSVDVQWDNLNVNVGLDSTITVTYYDRDHNELFSESVFSFIYQLRTLHPDGIVAAFATVDTDSSLIVIEVTGHGNLE